MKMDVEKFRWINGKLLLIDFIARNYNIKHHPCIDRDSMRKMDKNAAHTIDFKCVFFLWRGACGIIGG